MYNVKALFEEEYEVSRQQYVSARLAYERRCGLLSNMYLWCAIGLIITALPFIFLRSMMSISFGWLATAAIALFGIVLIVVNAYVRPNRISAKAEKEYNDSPVYKAKHKISLYRDTFTYENSCEHIDEYYSQTSAVIETKTAIVIAVDTLGGMIVIPKNQNENTLRSIFRERYNRRYMK